MMMLPNEISSNKERVYVPGLGNYLMTEYFNVVGEITRVTFDRIKK